MAIPIARAPRLEVRLEAAYEDRDRQVFLTTRNLSETGAYLVASDPPDTGVRARLMLELPGEPAFVRLDGVVARRVAGDGFAVRFDLERTPQGAREALRAFATASE